MESASADLIGWPTVQEPRPERDEPDDALTPVDIEAEAPAVEEPPDAGGGGKHWEAFHSRETPPGEGDPPGPHQPDEPAALSKREIDMLSFERQWWRRAGAKEQAIRDQFDLSPTRYYQTLNALLDTPAALEYDPALVNRLRRIRASRLRTRRG